MLIALLLAGCSQTRSIISGLRGLPVPGEAGYYLQDIRELAAASPARQAEILDDASAALVSSPGPQSDLKYALVLATPGHAATNLEEARSTLRAVLGQIVQLTADETSLATVYLQLVERTLELQAETQRLRASTANAATARETALASQLAIAEAESLRLRRDLEDALDKLAAIESIERSIRDR